MQNFYYDIPTKVFFGEGQIQNLPELVSEFGQCALLVYGGGSVKRSGLYDTIVSLLKRQELQRGTLRAWSQIHGLVPCAAVCKSAVKIKLMW